nr:adenylate/guanylate cyclase domain-containing protein [Halorhodospira halophila]
MAATVAGVLHTVGWLVPVERVVYDQRTQWLHGDAHAPEEIVILYVDEYSIRAMEPAVGRWPWPRSLWADLLEFLAHGRPAAVVFDVLFTESAREDGGAGDAAFAQASAALGGVVHAMQFLEANPREDRSADPLPKGMADRYALGDTQGWPDPRFQEHGVPVAPLADKAEQLGVVTTGPDRDGVHRRLPPLLPYDGEIYPALGVAALLAAGQDSSTIDWDEQGVQWADQTLATDASGQALVNPYAEFDSYPVVELFEAQRQIRRGELADLRVDPEVFNDRIVFVGASAAALHDLKATPLSGRTPGVELHASLIGNLLDGQTLRFGPGTIEAVLVPAAAGAVGLAVLLVPALSARVLLPLAVVAAWTAWVLVQHAAGIVWSWLPLVVGVLLAWVTVLVFLGFTEGRDRRRVRQLLAQYVSPAVLQEVVDRRGEVATGEVGSTEQVTLLFSDIRGFTSLSEGQEAASVVELLNIHLGEMSEAIFEHDGTLDKFIGDAVMAFWGAPVRVRDHADRAVRAALAMTQRLEGVNEAVVARGGKPLAIGIGLHTGEVVLGNIGSVRKLDYTVIGDNVNVASRLEDLTKAYGCSVLISGDTYADLPQGWQCRYVDRVQVRGRQRMLDLYEPIAPPEGA